MAQLTAGAVGTAAAASAPVVQAVVNPPPDDESHNSKDQDCADSSGKRHIVSLPSYLFTAADTALTVRVFSS